MPNYCYYDEDYPEDGLEVEEDGDRTPLLTEIFPNREEKLWVPLRRDPPHPIQQKHIDICRAPLHRGLDESVARDQARLVRLKSKGLEHIA